MKLTDCIRQGIARSGDMIMTFDLHPCIVLATDYDEGSYIYNVFDVVCQDYGNFTSDETIIINECAFNYLLALTTNMRNMIWKILRKIALDNEDEFNLYSYQGLVESLNILENLKSNPLNEISQRIIFSNGIKHVIKHCKGTGNRIIELNNGEVWKVHRVKKNYLANSVKKFYKKYGDEARYYHNFSTTHYELLEKIR